MNKALEFTKLQFSTDQSSEFGGAWNIRQSMESSVFSFLGSESEFEICDFSKLNKFFWVSFLQTNHIEDRAISVFIKVERKQKKFFVGRQFYALLLTFTKSKALFISILTRPVLFEFKKQILQKKFNFLSIDSDTGIFRWNFRNFQ